MSAYRHYIASTTLGNSYRQATKLALKKTFPQEVAEEYTSVKGKNILHTTLGSILLKRLLGIKVYFK